MFSNHKTRLAAAIQLHDKAVRRKKAARQQLFQLRQSFLSEPLNLLYPYTAGILICASQLKSDATGLKRIPFLNIAKAGVGLWTLISRIKKLKDRQPKSGDSLEKA